jgi:hypothetical protein
MYQQILTILQSLVPGLGGPQLTSTVMKRRRVDEESLGGASEPGSEQDFEGS